MNKADALLIAQLLTTMREAVTKMEKYSESKDMENFEVMKKEVLTLQRKIDSLL